MMSTQLSSPAPARAIAFWFPDWPITARALTTPTGWNPDAPVAIIHSNIVVACSPSARANGVHRGQRKRDAQAACAEVRLMPHDPDRDARAFSPVISRIEALAPGVHILRPGLCALRARGPSRYYGGEREAALVLLQAISEHGVADAMAGIADGPFTAEQAARAALFEASGERIHIVAASGSADFLAPLPIATLDDPDVASLLARLGVHTLGDFAALDEKLVRDRFSEHGVRLHALAGGADSRSLTARVPPPELTRAVSFDSPLEIAEQVAFAVRQSADDVIAAVSGASLVCTEIRVEFTDENGTISDRLWLHPTCFDAAAIVDRVRWQLQATWEASGASLQRGITKVRLIPEAVDAASHHQPSLLGRGTDSRVHHALSRVQAILGHRGVVTAEVIGGRMLTDRQQFVPWGDRIVAPAVRDRPWPGHLDPPLPTTIFSTDTTIELLTSDRVGVVVDDRGGVNAPPAILATPRGNRRIVSWAGPWPIAEKLWINQPSRYRFQLVDEASQAWVVLYEKERWVIEGRYD